MEKHKILLVDDDKGQRLRLNTLLTQKGYTVQEAANGEQALASAKVSPPDILFSDVMMDGLDGYQLAMAFKTDPVLSNIPIALHSNVFNNAKDQMLAEAIGVSTFFDKSISTDELLNKLHQIKKQENVSNCRPFDENTFLRMHADVLSEKMGLKLNELNTERSRANATAKKLHNITDAIPDLISEIDTSFRYIYVNNAYQEWYGITRTESIGLHIKAVYGPQTFEQNKSRLGQALQGKAIEYEETFTHHEKGERDIWVRYVPHRNKHNVVVSIHIIVSDITVRKAAEKQLKKTNQSYALMLQINKLYNNIDTEEELLEQACIIINQEDHYPLTWIGSVERDGHKRVTPVAQAGTEHGYLDGLHISWADNKYGDGPTGRAIRSRVVKTVSSTHNAPNYEPWRDKAKKHNYASSIAIPIVIGGEVEFTLNIYSRHHDYFSDEDKVILQKLGDDIGQGIQVLRLKKERNQNAVALQKSNQAYRTLVDLQKILARNQDEATLLQDVCHLLNNTGSYSLAWIGYAQQDSNKNIKPVAFSGNENSQHYLNNLHLSWDDVTLGQAPSGRSIRTGETIIVNDVETDVDFAPWREKAKKNGYLSIIAIPMKMDGKVFSSLILYANVVKAFYTEEVQLLEEFAEELSYGITALRQQKQHQKVESELAYQQKLFEAVLRHIPDTLIITDTKHRIILCNTALIRDFGYFPEDLTGETPAILYASEKHFKRQQELRFNTLAFDINTPYNIEYQRKDGSIFQGETLGTIFRDKDRNILGYITIVRDITERQAMDEQRMQLEMQLQQSQKMESVGQLTGGIAHDFNNILASILGYTELALHHDFSNHQQEGIKIKRYLNEIYGAGERARDIISQLLAFSRTGASTKKLIALSSLIEETSSLLTPTLSSSIELSLNMTPDLPQIEADGNQIHQILMNLCINSRDAMEGRGEITITLSQQDRYDGLCRACGEKFYGNYLRLSVSDNGSGVPDDVVTRMFDPFFTTKAIGKGTGMGLSMVHGIVHSHDGHIQVITSSAGTTFHIYLPLPEGQHKTGFSSIKHDSEVRPHIVIIDDEPALLEFLSQLLEFNGYETTTFSDPTVALDALTQKQIACDLVISDQMMPGINGTELAALLKQRRPNLPLLLCSGNTSEFNKASAKEYGYSGFVQKPIESTHLLSLIQRHLCPDPDNS